MGRGANTPGLHASAASIETSSSTARSKFKAQLFRVGSVEHHREKAPVHFEIVDRYKPDERVGRSDAIYCAFAVGGMARWIDPMISRHINIPLRQISYRGAEPYAYKVHDWDILIKIDRMEHDPEGLKEICENYWASGVPLSQLDPDSNPEEWEVLVDPACVKTTRPVSRQRVVREAHSDGAADNVEWAWFRNRKFKGKSYRELSSED